jgi:hypothetical protein
MECACLSQRERRLLAEIALSVYEQDPALARRLSRMSTVPCIPLTRYAFRVGCFLLVVGASAVIMLLGGRSRWRRSGSQLWPRERSSCLDPSHDGSRSSDATPHGVEHCNTPPEPEDHQVHMTVAELLEQLADTSPSAEIFVLVDRGGETITTPVAELLEVDQVDGSAVVFRLVEA